MANLYYAKDLRKVFDDKICSLVLEIADNENLPNEKIINGLHEIQHFRKFADIIIADLEEVDRAEDAEKRELEETAKAAKEAYDNLFDRETWLKKAEETNGTNS